MKICMLKFESFSTNRKNSYEFFCRNFFSIRDIAPKFLPLFFKILFNFLKQKIKNGYFEYRIPLIQK